VLARGVSQCAHCERSTRLQTRSLINYLYARNVAFPSPFFSSLCFRLAIKSRCSQPFITAKGPTTRSRERILTTKRLCLFDLCKTKEMKKTKKSSITHTFRFLRNYNLPRVCFEFFFTVEYLNLLIVFFIW